MSDTDPIDPAQRSIRMVVASDIKNEVYRLGMSGVTHIEETIMPGLYGNLPYIRIWKGDIVYAEFCQHGIYGVYFDEPNPKEQP